VTFVFNMLAVNNDLPVRSVAELIAYAKKVRASSPTARPATAPPAASAASSSRR